MNLVHGFLVVGLVVASGVSALARPAGSQDARLENDLERSTVYVGESVIYGVFAVNCGEAGEPDLGDLPDFEVSGLGANQESRSYNLNGRITSTTIVKHHYRLRPRKAGVFTLPAPKLTVQGRTLQGKSLRLVVKKPEAQDLVRLELRASKARVYRREPFTVTLDIYLKALPSPYEETDPLRVGAERPNLNLPWVKAPEGLQGEDLQTWLRRYFDRSGRGFTINEVNQRRDRVFPSFFNDVNTFRPEPERVTREGLDGKEHLYHRYRLEHTFEPLKAGRYDFGGVTLKGAFPSSVSRQPDRFGRSRDQADMKNVYAAAPGLVVTVLEPSSEGRPEGYTGGIGAFRVWATARPDKLRVGDPLTVTLFVEGKAGLEDVGPVALGEQEAITRQFKVYEDLPTGEIKQGRKVFVYSLRPLEADIQALPPIAFSYFDVDKEAYRTVRTEPVPLTVTRAELLDPGDVVVSKNSSGTTDLTERQEGIFANLTDPGGLANERVRPLVFGGVVAGLLALYAALALAAGLVRRRYADPVAVRRRQAFPQGLQALRAAARERDVVQRLTGALNAFTGVVAALRNVPREGLTARDVGELARDLGDEELAARLVALLEECEAVQFGATSVSESEGEQLVHEAGTHLEALARVYRRNGRSKLASAGVALAMVFVGVGSVPAQSADVTRLFIKAQERYDQARTPEDFLAAAALFRKIVAEEDYRNGAVLYNLGNAYYRGGELGRAIAAYREAQRYLPGNDYLDANLRQALARRVDRFPEPPRTLVDHILFWTRSVAYRTQFVLALIAAAAAFLIAVVRLFRPGLQYSRFALGAALLLTVFLAAGSALSAYRYEVVVHGVLVEPKTQVLKAPGGEPAYDRPLHEGTEFVVAETRGREPGRWFRIRFAGDREGWIPAGSAVTY